MKVLITGSNGQLGWELQRTCPDNIEVMCLPRTELDITDQDSVISAFEQYQPDAVINAAAYTAVDKAETDRDAAFLVNETGSKNLAFACAKTGCYLLQISTDFVFDGTANRPYSASAATSPLGVYGESKRAGEEAIATELDSGWAVIRTAWVYSVHGGNFVKSMLNLMSNKPALGIISDQVGTPTWAKGLALVSWQAVQAKIEGYYHWTDAGVASWYDFAVAIQREALALGLLDAAIPVNAIATEDYPTPASRPSYSVLDKSALLAALPDIEHKHWQSQLAEMLNEYKAVN